MYLYTLVSFFVCYLRYAHVKDNLVYKDFHKYLFLNTVIINIK